MLVINVGIDKINIYSGPLAIDTATIAMYRQVSSKIIEDIGFNSRSIIPPFEDPVTLAVNAAKPLIDETSPNDYGLLIIGTESGFDYGKPISTYIHKYLNLSQNCRNFEIKHACYSGTAALQMAASWLRCETNRDKKALVIATDVARPHFVDPAELTSGSGAVAMVLSANPAVLLLDPISGYATQEVYDVARPTCSFEWGDPVLSLYSFIDLLEASFIHYCHNNKMSVPATDQFKYILYHTPLLSLVKQSHSALLELCDSNISSTKIAESFAKMVAPALKYNFELGNTYSSSLYVALTGIIEACDSDSLGSKIGFYSYGSGACAEFFSGQLTVNSKQEIKKRNMSKVLAERRALSFPEYEKLMNEYNETLSLSHYQPNFNTLNGVYEEYYDNNKKLVMDKINNYHRSYRWTV